MRSSWRLANLHDGTDLDRNEDSLMWKLRGHRSLCTVFGIQIRHLVTLLPEHISRNMLCLLGHRLLRKTMMYHAKDQCTMHGFCQSRGKPFAAGFGTPGNTEEKENTMSCWSSCTKKIIPANKTLIPDPRTQRHEIPSHWPNIHICQSIVVLVA